MHEDHGRPSVPNDVEHLRVGSGSHVVHDGGAHVDGSPSDLRLASVDGDRDRRFSSQALDDWHHPIDLLLDLHGIRTGAGGLTAHVEEVGPLLDHANAGSHRHLRVEEPPAVGERVWSDVDDPHDMCTGTAVDHAVAHPPQDRFLHTPIVARWGLRAAVADELERFAPGPGVAPEPSPHRGGHRD